MTKIKPKSDSSIKVKCKRCHRLFTPKKPDQIFGEKCARTLRMDHIEVKNKKGEIVAVIV